MDDRLWTQLQEWHEQNHFREIVACIEAIPEAERGLELTSQLARAYNNLDNYDEAIRLLLSVAEAGASVAAWHYRLGYAYFYQDHNQEALRCFQRALELDPEDEHVQMFVDMAKRAVWVDELKSGGNKGANRSKKPRAGSSELDARVKIAKKQ